MYPSDEIQMPPPSVIYRKGTLTFLQALQSGDLHLSSTTTITDSSTPLTSRLDESERPSFDSHSDARTDNLEKGHVASEPTSVHKGLYSPMSVPSAGPQAAEEHLQSFHLSSIASPPKSMEMSNPLHPSITQSQTGAAETCSNEEYGNDLVKTTVPSKRSSMSSLIAARSKRKFSELGDASTETTMEKTRFKDIIGHTAVKVRCDELLLPMWLPRRVTDAVLTGVRSMPASILLYGPPGCGKTKLARALAGESQAAFLSVVPSDVYSKFVGESEAAIREIFSEAWERASQLPSNCAVVFFDEIDAFGQTRGQESTGIATGGETGGCSRRVLAELLTQLNLVNDRNISADVSNDNAGRSNDDDEETLIESPPRIIVVAATNRPEDCDPALLRRFGIQLHVGLPTVKDRKKIILRLLKGVSYSISKQDIDLIVAAMEGWSGSDIENVTRDAAMTPIRESIREATLVRRRAAKQQQSCGTASCQEAGDDERLEPDTRAVNTLLSSFLNLRPVNLIDFQKSIAFFHPDDGHCEDDNWYDSSSEEDDEEGDNTPQVQEILRDYIA